MREGAQARGAAEEVLGGSEGGDDTDWEMGDCESIESQHVRSVAQRCDECQY